MKKAVTLKKATVAVSLVLALAVGVSVNAKSAWAGYLSAPTLSPTAVSGSFGFNVNGALSPSGYATATSSYGDTVPTPSAITSATGISPVSTVADASVVTVGSLGALSSTGANLLYDGTSLSLTNIASSTNPYSAPGLSGNILSQVFRITSGANTGDLVFTYQFNVSQTSTLSASSATIGTFNNGGNYTLGAGINATGVATTNDPTAGNGVDQSGTYAPLGSVLTGVSPTNNPLIGTVFFASNGSTDSLDYELSSGAIGPGGVSSQIFLATNATSYSLGSLSVANSGISGFADVYVPGTPEPSTLVLLGTGLGLLTFMALRKRQNKVVL